MTPGVSAVEWNSFLSDQSESHLLQSAEWGELKTSFGWTLERVQDGACGAQILFRTLPLGYSIAYIPKGPIGPWLPDLLPHLDRICKAYRAILLKVEPDSGIDPKLENDLRSNGFNPSDQSIQPEQTLIVDMGGSDEELLGRMRQKTRYNIRLAGRKGVVVRPWKDLDGFGKMMQETGNRDEFGIHASSYYKKAYELFHPKNACELFLAEYEKQPLAAIFVFAFGKRAWYLYGASSAIERNRMPTYLLQWEAMKWAKQQGCTEYDLWGVPTDDEETLEREFTSRRDGLWGVYRFKRGFGGALHQTAGAWDRPYIQPLYYLYQLVSSRIWK